MKRKDSSSKCLVCGSEVEMSRNERKRMYCNKHKDFARQYPIFIINNLRKSFLNPRTMAFEIGMTTRAGGLRAI